MTKFQALFVLWLRHNSLRDCSWRELAAHYYNRYKSDGTLLPFNERINFKETPLKAKEIFKKFFTQNYNWNTNIVLCTTFPRLAKKRT